MDKENLPKTESLHNEEEHHKFMESFRRSFRDFVRSFWLMINRTMNLRDGADIQNTTEGIKRDISFRGHTAWILMLSIFIASIGLNVNSTAVVIGAMLISPLMGPILGIGLAIGTHDWETLIRSLKNFGIAIFISLFTSTLYFLITPLHDVQPELLARTKPTFLDVLIAIFGGFAGIIAGSRKEKNNVVPGVAIATALMPPLCTAGYGLATLNLKFFFGAFYLFFLNSVFISLSTFIVVRYLHFPRINFVNPVREKQIRRYMGIFLIIVIIPSASIFWNVIKESRFHATVLDFVKKEVVFPKSEIINTKITYNDTLSIINIYIIGEMVPDETIAKLNLKLDEYGLIKKQNFWKAGYFSVTDSTVVKVHQATSANLDEIDDKISSLRGNLTQELRTGIIEDIYKKNEELIKDKDEKILLLENELIKQKQKIDTIPFNQIAKELKVQYEKIEKFSYAKTIETKLDTSRQDTISTFLIKWNKKTPYKTRRKNQKQLANWLKVRLNLDTVRVIAY